MIQTRLREILLQRELEYQEPYTIQGVAEATGLSQNAVSFFRSGRTTRFDAHVLDALCRVLEVQVGDLLVYVPDAEGST